MPYQGEPIEAAQELINMFTRTADAVKFVVSKFRQTAKPAVLMIQLKLLQRPHFTPWLPLERKA